MTLINCKEYRIKKAKEDEAKAQAVYEKCLCHSCKYEPDFNVINNEAARCKVKLPTFAYIPQYTELLKRPDGVYVHYGGRDGGIYKIEHCEAWEAK